MSCDDIDAVSCELFLASQKTRFPQAMSTRVVGVRRAMRRQPGCAPGAGLVHTALSRQLFSIGVRFKVDV